MRLYNGCPDSELAAKWKADSMDRNRLDVKAKELFGKTTRARITYFPLEDKYAACMWVNDENYVELTGFCYSIVECSLLAINRLVELDKRKRAV